MSVERIVDTVAETAVEVSGGLVGRRTYTEGENPSGEDQLEADVWADSLLEERLLAVDSVGSYASEERPSVVEGDGEGRHHVAVDPLDGSSNLRSNNPMGVIFAVYDAPLPAPGRRIVAAGWVMLGPITTMVLATDGPVTEFALEPADGGTDADHLTDGVDGEPIVRRPLQEDLALPEEPTVYGIGGRVPDWSGDLAAFVEGLEEDRLKLRYGGAMVADVNQVLTYGGLFAYPALADAPNGKLRLQFEGNPVAHVIEAAGGASSDGERSILDVEADEVHQRIPVHVGNPELIERLEDALA
ncbi:MAG: class 1 fructose-bisphosphatase [Haloarculaceae archaeon]